MGRGNPLDSGDLPPGGDTGQHLVKQSNADNDADWEDDVGGGVDSVNGETGVVVLETVDIDEDTNLYYTEERVNENANVVANTSHRSSDGKDHSDVVLNNSHRSGNGSDHANVALNDTHRGVVSGNPHDVTKSDISLENVDNIQQIPLTQKAAAEGVATLNLSGKVPAEQLPTSASNLLGAYDIITNTPTVVNGVGSNGDYYLCSTAGTRDFGDGNVTVAPGDQLIYNGSIWEDIPSSNTVLSVNDKIGIVVLDTDDIDEGISNEYYTEAKVDANTNVTANTAHRSSDGKNHSDVVLNNSHRSDDGSDHANVALNDTHRGSDGKNHSDVVLNNSHRSGDGSDHENVSLNDTHRGSAGIDHSDVVLNNSHRALVSGNPHVVTKTEVGLPNVTNEAQIPLTQKGVANGVATLDSAVRIPEAQLPLAAAKFKGDYNIITDSPTLSDASGINGEWYLCSVSGSRNFGSGTITVKAGYGLVHNGTIFQAHGLPIGETSDTAYRGDRGVIAFDHSSSDGKDHSDVISNNTHRSTTTGNPHNLDTDDVTEAGNEYYTEAKVDAHEFSSIKFDTDLAVESYLDGRMGWDPVNKCPYFYNDRPDVRMQIGRELWARSCNNTGSDILNGRIVFISGIDAGCPEIMLAQPDEYDASRTIGVATEDILDSGEGEVTSYGLVSGVNTSGLSLGSVYLDHDGEFLSIKPTGTHFVVFVGTILVSDPVNGVLFVNPSIADYTVEVVDTNGFPAQWRAGTTLSFVDGTRTFTIAPTGDHFHYYINGDTHKVSDPEDVIITNVEGLHVIYYDNGTLTCLANPDDGQIDEIIRLQCLVAYIYWDAANQESNYFADERHGISMAPDSHSYNHFTRHAQYLTGLDIANVSADASGNVNADAQFSISLGFTTDEDLITVYSTISSIVGLPIYYIDGANSYLRRILEPGYSVLTDITSGVDSTGRLVWNDPNGGTWKLSLAVDDSFVLCHVFAINGYEGKDQQIAIVGQANYTTLEDARFWASYEIENIKTGYPFEESVPIATLILQTNSSYTNGVKARVRSTLEGLDFIDWTETNFAKGLKIDSHSNLIGLNFDSHRQYNLLAGRSSDTTNVNTATYNLLPDDFKLQIDYTDTGTCEITIPTAQILAFRGDFVIKDSGGNAKANNITVVTEGAETIDGLSTLTLNSDDESYTLYSDGTNLFVKSHFKPGTGIPKINETISAHIDGLDVSSLSPFGILAIDDGGSNRELRSLTGGSDGDIIHIQHLGTGNFKLKDESGTFQLLRCPDSSDVTIPDYGGATLIFDGASGYWIVTGLAL